MRGEKVHTYTVYPIWFTYRKCCGCRSDWIRTRLPDPGSILISWILIRPLVHTKEHILVRERTAPPCVFQTIAHPTSPCSAVYSNVQSPVINVQSPVTVPDPVFPFRHKGPALASSGIISILNYYYNVTEPDLMFPFRF